MTSERLKNHVHEPASEGQESSTHGDLTHRRNFSITAALAAGFGTLIALAVGATLWVSLSAGWDNAVRLVEVTGDSILDALIIQVEDQLSASAAQTAFVADLILSGELDPRDEDRFNDIMLGSLAAAPQVHAIAHIDKDGKMTLTARSEGQILRIAEDWREDPQVRSIFKRAKLSDVARWEGVVWLRTAMEPGLAYIYPLRKDDEYQGFIASVVRVSTLSKLIEATGDSEDLRVFILTGSRKVLAHHKFSESLDSRSPSSPLPDIQELADPFLNLFLLGNDEADRILDKRSGTETAAAGKLVEKDGLGALFFYRDVVGFGSEVWTFAIYAPLGSLQATGKSFLWAGLAGIAILALAIVFALVLSRTISRPFTRFAEASGAVRDLNIREAKPLDATYLSELNRAAGAYNSMLGALRWFEIYLPRSLVLRLLRQGEKAVRSQERMVTVLFTDIVGFTNIAASLAPSELADLLNAHFALIAKEIEKESGPIDKYIGDSIMAFWGAPDDQPDHGERAVRAILAANRGLQADNLARMSK
ncbi:MAG: adenylate/guanylate cyclase domain-containing protein, partial [Kiloniellales bacterium]|nr:adenylate/guanylate cyclase domain-containing protein [Kiloniellales bacterium]